MYLVSQERKEQPLRWRNLTPYERSVLTNGCGDKGGIFNPPDYMFTASCDHHDVQYFIGATEADRKKADKQFYEAMKFDASLQSWYIRWWYYRAAWTYYIAVRWFGGKFFTYRDREATWDDLEEHINKSTAQSAS